MGVVPSFVLRGTGRTGSRSSSPRGTGVASESVSLAHDEARVIVIGNGSVDGTEAAVRERHPGVDLIELGANRGAAARNVGVARAGTPYVAFADDEWWAPGALARVERWTRSTGLLLGAWPGGR